MGGDAGVMPHEDLPVAPLFGGEFAGFHQNRIQ